MKIVTAAMLALALIIPAASQAVAGSNFPSPYSPVTLWGKPVDWCLTFGKGCGQPAADKFCQHMGFKTAGNIVKTSSPKLPTIVIGSGQTCSTPGKCAAIASLVCYGKKDSGNLENDVGMNPVGEEPETGTQPLKAGDKIEGSLVVHEYKMPKWNGAPLDNCKFFGIQCGKPAADAFCQAKGFGYSAKAYGASYAQVTRVIGDNKVCTDDSCRAFSYIKCARSKNG